MNISVYFIYVSLPAMVKQYTVTNSLTFLCVFLCLCVCLCVYVCSVLQTLALKKSQAMSVCEVLDMVQRCLLSLGKPHLFQAPSILFLQELLACQKDFTKYD